MTRKEVIMRELEPILRGRNLGEIVKGCAEASNRMEQMDSIKKCDVTLDVGSTVGTGLQGVS